MSATLSPITVARVNLLDRFSYLALPWTILLSAFAVNLAIFGILEADGDSNDDAVTGGMLSIFVYVFVIGVLSVAQGVGFSQLLSASRRTYFLGTLVTGALLSVMDGLGLAVLAALEPATGGWGIDMTFFRWTWVTDSGFLSTWLVYAAFLGLAFSAGITYAMSYRRWGVIGSWLTALANAVVVLVAIALLVWIPGLGDATRDAFAALTPAGVGALALVVAALLAGVSWLMLRRAPAR